MKRHRNLLWWLALLLAGCGGEGVLEPQVGERCYLSQRVVTAEGQEAEARAYYSGERCRELEAAGYTPHYL